MKLFSVVIPAYNEENQISSCLDALVKQSTDRRFEVIVVDNNSTDNTSKIVNNYKKKLNIKVVIEEQKGRGSARKTGFKKASGDIILSTDADTIVPEDWIERIITIFESNKNVLAVTGVCQIVDNSKLTNALFNIFQPLSMRIYRLFFGHYWLSGFNFAVRKSSYLTSGGFDPKLNVQEDIDLSFKVSKVGKIKFLPDLCVNVSGRRFQKGFIKGVTPYLSSFSSYFFLKRKDVYLDNPR